MILATLASRALRLLDPERAHDLTLSALRLRNRAHIPEEEPRLTTEILGLSFPNPIGLAAGFDKNGAVPDAALRLGFGFVEVGTVTPLAQAGNPKPRIFRLPADGGVINRLGFNNGGHDQMAANLERRRGRAGIVGINVGANAASEDRISDYVAGITRFAAMARYLTVNISSPNTPGLRTLQAGDMLQDLLQKVMAERDRVADMSGRTTPVLVKIAPDLTDDDLQDIAKAAAIHSIDGLIISNTTLSRDGLSNPDHRDETGGLSGRPLYERSTAMLARARQLVGPDLPLIGVGGVDGPEAAWGKIRAGADLVQLYTGLVYEGPALVRQIKRGLVRRLDEKGLANICDVRDEETDRWAAIWSVL